ncbi:hypothetical protein AADZ91_10640 [Colwelliaceae bacterium 6441]
MFVGHYAVSFALRATHNKASLGVLFLGVQFVDLLFFAMTFFGIERFSIIENYTDSTHFRLDFMPYSHSLVAVMFWSLAAFIILKVLQSKKKQAKGHCFLLIAIAILSHWLLDLIVHTPDLPVFLDNTYHLGFGLWNNAVLTYVLEAILLIVGLCFYLKSTHKSGQQITLISRFGTPAFVILLLAINVVNIFGPLSVEDNKTSTAISAMVAYCLFSIIAFWLDKKRIG